MSSISIVGAGSIGITRIGGSTDVNVASSGVGPARSISRAFIWGESEVEAGVTGTFVFVTDVGARGVCLAWVKSARIDEALVSIAVKAVIAFAALGTVIIAGASSVNIAGIGRSADIDVASSWVSPG